MTLGLINANPVVHAKKERVARTEDLHCDDAIDPLKICQCERLNLVCYWCGFNMWITHPFKEHRRRAWDYLHLQLVLHSSSLIGFRLLNFWNLIHLFSLKLLVFKFGYDLDSLLVGEIEFSLVISGYDFNFFGIEYVLVWNKII